MYFLTNNYMFLGLLVLAISACSNKKRSSSSSTASPAASSNDSGGGVFSSSGSSPSSSSGGGTVSSSGSSSSGSGSSGSTASACTPTTGSLGSNGSEVVEVDSFTHADFSTGLVVEEQDTSAPPYIRAGVKRAHSFCLNSSSGQFCRNFWFASQFEPEYQWVNYEINTSTLGVGLYDIEVDFLSFDSLSELDSFLVVMRKNVAPNSDPNFRAHRVAQKRIPLDRYYRYTFRDVFLCRDSLVRIQDSRGNGQFLFPKMTFRKVASSN